MISFLGRAGMVWAWEVYEVYYNIRISKSPVWGFSDTGELYFWATWLISGIGGICIEIVQSAMVQSRCKR